MSVSIECMDQCQSAIVVGNCEKYSVYLFLHCHCCAFCEEGKGKKRYTIQTSCIDDYHQFWLLSAGCPVCGYDSDNGDADDTKNMCICLDGNVRRSDHAQLSEMIVLF